MSNQPPFDITPAILNTVEQIGELLGRMDAQQQARELSLRRVSRIQTLQGTLAIEGNTLAQEQIQTILQGKPVIAPPREIQEVRNAIKVYDALDQFNPTAKTHLLKAHKLLMTGLLDAPGKFRQSGVGVVGSEKKVLHVAPPAHLVPKLVADLQDWLKHTDHHPLITSCVFHYEFEFIHPFEDGNGRIGRLWQTVILSRWNPIFATIPVESMIHAHQQDYYNAIIQSSEDARSTVFIQWMLNIILQTLKASVTPQVAPQVTPQVRRLLKILDMPLSRQQIMAKLKLRDRKSLAQRYLQPALEAGLIQMTRPDKPNSSLQQYQITLLGQQSRDAAL
ncbi:MAG TPA: cell filamentation protein Fic [Phycisphaerales bacterium]|nr:cell filamentation protein Fic [Phycisphaerales bacterium]HCD31383.1 cell filamentation protein Fic [Phycisphaerales bacterium]|tara:strand:- start:1078 stop:2082 length:1005 start_codon:yes stop_codon:yes gene_type:complete